MESIFPGVFNVVALGLQTNYNIRYKLLIHPFLQSLYYFRIFSFSCEEDSQFGSPIFPGYIGNGITLDRGELN